MKKFRFLPALTAALLVALLTMCIVFLAAGNAAEAETDPLYKFSVADYRVTYDISADCAIAVTEDIKISYEGSQSTGFIRDIPANRGVRIRDVGVKKITSDDLDDTSGLSSVYYDVSPESNYVCVDIGSSTIKTGKTESYRITYNYYITNSAVNSGVLSLNPIGTGWECTITSAQITLLLPGGYESAKCWYGPAGSTLTRDFDVSVISGRTVLSASAANLSAYNGVSFDITFEDGAISAYFDFTPFIAVIAAAVILVVMVIVKLLFFNKSQLTPIVNYEAPDKMDPLLMGKLIDNKVNGEDITAMIYYWADKGYLKINFDDEDNPTIIRLVQNLPEIASNYERTLFYGLFSGGADSVKPSSFAGGLYYGSVQKATNEVNAKAKGLYDSKSIGVSVVFTLIAGLVLGTAPMLAAMLISSTFNFVISYIDIVPMLILYALTETIMYNKLKHSKKRVVTEVVGVAVIAAAFVVAWWLLLPEYLLGNVACILLAAVCAVIAMSSVMLISRTKSYTKKLNDIVGFREFIKIAEKDQLEMLLEDDPQFYYHILPYAQVLGVSDLWEEKFESLTVQPPAWATGNMFNNIVTFHIINQTLRRSMTNMNSRMVSRPSGSAGNGGGTGRFGGGGFGGFSGGGFGGGGGRGR